MENKNEGNENKIYLETLIALWIKWTGTAKIKHKDFVDAVPVIPCQRLTAKLIPKKKKKKIQTRTKAMIENLKMNFIN